MHTWEGLALKGEARAWLTDAEFDVLQRVLAGRSNAEIALERASSKRTVANQIATMFRKLGVRSRRELVASVHGEMVGHISNAEALTSREQSVLAFVSQGCSDKTIASYLGCSTSAVGALLTRARRKQRLFRERPAFR